MSVPGSTVVPVSSARGRGGRVGRTVVAMSQFEVTIHQQPVLGFLLSDLMARVDKPD